MHNLEVMSPRKNKPLGVPVQEWFDEEERRTPGFIAAIDAEAGKLVLAQQLKKLRESAGMTQGQLAEKIGTQQPGVARVERGRALPSLEMLFKIASALGMRVTIEFRPRKGKKKRGRRGLTPEAAKE